MSLVVSPAQGLPDWVVSIFEARQATYQEYLNPQISRLSHRGSAFFKLFSSASPDMLDIWERVPSYEPLVNPKPVFFVDCLSLATDAILPDQIIEADLSDPQKPARRLRSKDERLARKLAVLLRDLQELTPCHGIDGIPTIHSAWFGAEIEALIIEFRIELPAKDLVSLHKRHKITFTPDSKRGYVQHRRASDVLRKEVLNVSRELLAIKPEAWLQTLITELEAWPDFEAEQALQPLLISQKAGWADWLTQAALMLNEGYTTPFLRHKDWQVLIGLLFDTWPDIQKISEVLSRSSSGKN